MKYKQGDIVEWKNSNDAKIIWMICDDTDKGVVIHSDNLISIGTIVENMKDYKVSKFVGTVHISSAKS